MTNYKEKHRFSYKFENTEHAKANKIADVLSDINNTSLQEKIKAELVDLAHKFIIYDKATF